MTLFKVYTFGPKTVQELYSCKHETMAEVYLEQCCKGRECWISQFFTDDTEFEAWRNMPEE